MSADPSDRRTAWKLVVFSPVLWGLAATWGFYQSIPHLPRYREVAQRYFCGHQLEYVLVGLFCIGMAILLGRLVTFARERRALAMNVLEGLSNSGPLERDWAAQITALDNTLRALPARYRDTAIMTRCRDASNFVKTRQSVRGLEEHLKYLADDAVERLYDSYSLLLTINWAVPIIGFLGTVVGITLAIANVTPEQLDTSLDNVTGGLGVAFDTTTVALSFSLVLVFTYDWVKRSEQRLLGRIEQFSLQQLLPLFLLEDDAADPVQRAQADAAKQLLDRTELLIHDQTALWRDSMEGLRERWSATIDTQQQVLTTNLNLGVESTLTEHAGQLIQVRREFLGAFEAAASQFQHALTNDAARRDRQEAQSQEKQQELWTQIQNGLQDVVRSYDAHTEDLLDGFSERMQQWQTAMEHSSQSMEVQLQKMADLTGQLAHLCEQGEQLTHLERQLAENLGAVRAAETFEETLHNLTAAVHLLTARARPKAA
ncbi:MAG: MotA/TolQ/ExbB proton channel family protein [Planctomycetaceae bacterium]